MLKLPIFAMLKDFFTVISPTQFNFTEVWLFHSPVQQSDYISWTILIAL